MIYLDNAATTKPKKEVIHAMMPYFQNKWFNPSSLYNPSVKIKRDIEIARENIGKFINAKREEIFFTSCGSESNSWVLQGFINKCFEKGVTPTIITTVIEHKSILSCVEHMNIDIHFVGVDKFGFVNQNDLEAVLKIIPKENEILVSIQYANNEIGTIQDIKTLSGITHKYNAIFHTDAVQAFGHIPIDVKELGIDLLSASGHKINAPKGIGLLYKRNDIEINPLIYGSQMDGNRGGTENVPYIIGFAKAVELADIHMDLHLTYGVLEEEYVYDYLVGELYNIGCTLNGSREHRLLNNINITFSQNITGESLIYMLDSCGMYVSSGSACNSKINKPSYVLKAIGLSDEECMKSVRITISEDTTMDMAKEFISELKRQIEILEV